MEVTSLSSALRRERRLYGELQVTRWSVRFLWKVEPLAPQSHPADRDWLLERVWTPQQMATALELSHHTVSKIIRSGPYAGKFTPGSRGSKLYSRACLAYVFDHSTGIRAVPIMDAKWIPTATVRAELGISDPRTLHRYAREYPEWKLEPFAIRRVRGKPGLVEVMKVRAYMRLKAKLPPFAPSNWETLERLAGLTGRPVSFVAAHLAGVKGRWFRTPADRIKLHYRLTDVQRLLQKSPIKPGGDWLIEQELSFRLGRSPGWVKNNLDQSLVQTRLDDSGQPRRHYPPSELTRLGPLAAKVRRGPPPRRLVVDEGPPPYPADIRIGAFTSELQQAFPYTAQDFADAGGVSVSQAQNWLRHHRTRHTSLKITGTPGRPCYRYNEVIYQAWLYRPPPPVPRS
jgi:hypothetical protein